VHPLRERHHAGNQSAQDTTGPTPPDFQPVGCTSAGASAAVKSSQIPQQYLQIDFLSALFEAMPDLYFLLTMDGVIQDFRGRQLDELYVPPEAFLGHHVEEVLPAPVAAQFVQALSEAAQTDNVVTFEYQLSVRGAEAWFEARISALRDHQQAVCVVRNFSELHEARKQLESMAHYDALTGLANRALLDKLLEQSVRSARRNQQRMGVMFIDLDRFKDVNDTLGHAAGDLLLQLASRRLQSTLRESDTLARVGGDEFVVVLDDLESIDSASGVARKLMNDMCTPFDLQGTEVVISCSIGISIFPDDADNASRLLSYADTAMYRAKQQGRNDWRFYTADMTRAAMEHLELIEALRAALEDNSLTQLYQPQFDCETGRSVGVEALARWPRPGRDSLGPQRFITLAEQAGLARRLDRWSLESACRQLHRWLEERHDPGAVSVNLSIHSLTDETLPEAVAGLLHDYAIPAHHLQIEIKELALLGERPAARDCLKALIALGVDIAVDDFGSGYAALEYLRALPVTTLKIDAAFMRDVPGDPEQAIIANTVIAMGRALGMKVVAKGIENAEQADFIRHQHGIQGQGYYFSHPLSPEQVGELLD